MGLMCLVLTPPHPVARGCEQAMDIYLLDKSGAPPNLAPQPPPQGPVVYGQVVAAQPVAAHVSYPQASPQPLGMSKASASTFAATPSPGGASQASSVREDCEPPDSARSEMTSFT